MIQKVVPFQRQGRVFGFAQAIESAAAPITAFIIAPIAEFWIIPYVDSPQGAQSVQWLVGTGDTRGIALVFLISGVILAAAGAFAFATKTYRHLSTFYRQSESVNP